MREQILKVSIELNVSPINSLPSLSMKPGSAEHKSHLYKPLKHLVAATQVIGTKVNKLNSKYFHEWCSKLF